VPFRQRVDDSDRRGIVQIYGFVVDRYIWHHRFQRAAGSVGRKAGGVDVAPGKRFELQRRARERFRDVCIVVEFGHADDILHEHPLPRGDAVNRRRDNAWVCLCDVGYDLGERAREAPSPLPADSHAADGADRAIIGFSRDGLARRQQRVPLRVDSRLAGGDSRREVRREFAGILVDRRDCDHPFAIDQRSLAVGWLGSVLLPVTQGRIAQHARGDAEVIQNRLGRPGRREARLRLDLAQEPARGKSPARMPDHHACAVVRRHQGLSFCWERFCRCRRRAAPISRRAVGDSDRRDVAVSVPRGDPIPAHMQRIAAAGVCRIVRGRRDFEVRPSEILVEPKLRRCPETLGNPVVPSPGPDRSPAVDRSALEVARRLGRAPDPNVAPVEGLTAKDVLIGRHGHLTSQDFNGEVAGKIPIWRVRHLGILRRRRDEQARFVAGERRRARQRGGVRRRYRVPTRRQVQKRQMLRLRLKKKHNIGPERVAARRAAHHGRFCTSYRHYEKSWPEMTPHHVVPPSTVMNAKMSTPVVAVVVNVGADPSGQ
jgi:hypothetical protein